MDRTIIVPYRAEEKELSHILHNAIQGLTLLHPPSDELRKCLSDEMFIKPNQQAFFHVMHYLFRILDPQEFKKRFFWPIADKRCESNFRTSTIEYLKHINEKHNLNWNNIKSYLVVMPGGMKFINFLLEFIHFIVQELIKQKEKQLNLEANSYRSQLSEANLNKMCEKNDLIKNMASEFVDTLENLITEYDNKSQKIMQHLEMLSKDTGLSVDLLTDEKFLEKYENCNYQLFEQCYSDRSKKVLEMNNLVLELKEAMERFYCKETGYKYDKQRICQQLKRIRDHFPIDELVDESLGSKVTDEGVNINTLISTFNAINETIQNELQIFNKKPCVGEFVYCRLLSRKKELHEMETQMTNFKKVLYTNIKKCKNQFPKTPVRTSINVQTKKNIENIFVMKLVSTPPIKFEVPEGGGKPRLALVDSKGTNAIETTFNNFLAPPRASSIRQPTRHHSLMDITMSELNNTLNRSKIIDPMQLLHSTTKKDSSKYRAITQQQNISHLSINWKLRQTILNDNDEEKPTVFSAIPIDNTPKTHLKPLVMNEKSPQSLIKPASPTFLNQSHTPLGTNDRTRIANLQYQLDSSATFGVNSSESTSLNYAKKLSAVKKVQDASLNFANLSTSPSGRLEPLVTAEDLHIPKLKLNDMSLIDNNLNFNNSLVSEKPEPLLNSPVSCDITVIDEKISKSDNESPVVLDNQYDQEEDALFNISDSVLKDVTF